MIPTSAVRISWPCLLIFAIGEVAPGRHVEFDCRKESLGSALKRTVDLDRRRPWFLVEKLKIAQENRTESEQKTLGRQIFRLVRAFGLENVGSVGKV